MKKLTDRTAVVTGAASGIGRATSLALAKRGCRLAISDIDQAGLTETARQIEALGRPVSTHVVDVGDKKRMQEFASEVADSHPGVNILVNNAGVTVNASFSDHTLENFEWLMNINLWGVVYGCKFFLPLLSASDEAHIVNMSSLFGLIGVPQQTSYSASKFAVTGFSEALRAELAYSSNIGVTSVHPGGVATNIASTARIAEGEEFKRSNERIIATFKHMLPPEAAAEQIVRGILRNKARVLITRESHVGDFFKRILPGLTARVVLRQYRQYRAEEQLLLRADLTV